MRLARAVLHRSTAINNNGYAHGEDANHRLTADVSLRAKMEVDGWGYEGVVMCAEVSAATAAFTDTSTGSLTAWYWTFGDGNTSSVQHPGHTYSTAGTFVVTLTTSNAKGSDYTAGTLAIAEQGSGGRWWRWWWALGWPGLRLRE